MATVTSPSDFVAQIQEIVESNGMTLEDFIEDGKNDDLTDGNLRDLWVLLKDFLLKERLEDPTRTS